MLQGSNHLKIPPVVGWRQVDNFDANSTLHSLNPTLVFTRNSMSDQFPRSKNSCLKRETITETKWSTKELFWISYNCLISQLSCRCLFTHRNLTNRMPMKVSNPGGSDIPESRLGRVPNSCGVILNPLAIVIPLKRSTSCVYKTSCRPDTESWSLKSIGLNFFIDSNFHKAPVATRALFSWRIFNLTQGLTRKYRFVRLVLGFVGVESETVSVLSRQWSCQFSAKYKTMREHHRTFSSPETKTCRR